MTPDAFRRLALSFPGALEGEHMGHPDFRAPSARATKRGPIFASLSGDDGESRGMIKLPLDHQEALTTAHPDTFEPCPGAWGRQGCTAVNLPAARIPILRPAMAAAFKLATNKLPAAKAQRPRRARRASKH